MVFLEAVLSNAVVVIVPACLAVVVARMGRFPTLVRALWLLVFLKLLTPPLVPVPCLPDGTIAAVPETSRLAFAPSEGLATLGEPGTPSTEVQESPAVAIPMTLGNASAPPPASPSLEFAAERPDVVKAGRPAVTGRQVTLGLAAIWIAVGVFYVLHTLAQMVRFRRVIQLSSPAPPWLQARVRLLAGRMGLRRVPAVHLLSGAATPMVWAPWGAHLIIPGSQQSQLQRRQLDPLIAHELAHLRNGDHWVRWLEFVVTAIYWWHPVVWWARRAIREAEEEICDAWVVQTLPKARTTYATTLIDLVGQLSGRQPYLPPGASGLSQFHLVKRRITMILHANTAPRLPLAGWLTLVFVAGLLLPVAPTWGIAERESPQLAVSPRVAVTLEPQRPLVEAVVVAELGDEPHAPLAVEPMLAEMDVRVLADETDGQDIWVEVAARDDAEVASEAVIEIIAEMEEAIEGMDEEVKEAIGEAREELRELVRESPEPVQRELLEVDVRAILQEAVREAPQTVKLFVKAVDPVEVIDAQLAQVEVTLQEIEPDEALRDRVQRKLEHFLRQHIDELSRHTAREVRNIQRGIARETERSPRVVQQVLREVDFDEVLQEALADRSPIVQQIVEEVHVEEMVKEGLRQSSDARRDDRAEEARARSVRPSRQRDDRRIAQLEERLERLLREADELVEQLEVMKGQQRSSRRGR